MNTKTKSEARRIFSLRVKKSFKYQTLLVLLFAALFVSCSCEAKAQTKVIIINEIQISGGSGKTTQEFIELYNTTGEVVSLDGFSLKKKTKTQSTNPSMLLNPMDFKGDIPAHGYFLVAHPDYVENISADAHYSAAANGAFPSIASDNTIFLYDKEGNLLDKVGYGGAQDYEHSPASNIGDKKSIERKNFQDTDDNNSDFKILETPTPLNSFYKEEVDGDGDEETVVCDGSANDVILNEIYPNTENEKNEFVEIFNTGLDCVDISKWAIKDNTETASHKTLFPEKTFLDAGGYFYVEKNLYLNNDTDTVYLLDKNGTEIDKREYKDAVRGLSYVLIEDEWLWTLSPTKGKENIFEPVDEKPSDEVDAMNPAADIDQDSKIYSDTIIITELFPNPFKSEYEEYIELYNNSGSDVDLKDWILRDASKSGKYIFPKNIIIKAQEYLAIFKKDFKFALNNSGAESVTLFDPSGKEVTKSAYDGSKKNVSYNFNGSVWRWSKFLTPGKENIFNNEPYGKIKIPKDVYEKVYADFSVGTGDADGDEVKVTWDFGDKHKSYLAKTRHKYEKEGEYNGSVKLSDGSEDIINEFKIKVEEFPHPKVRIAAVNANPEGSDTKNETITIENKSKKKINLNGWSIATGSNSKKLVNHPIREDFEISKKKSKEITSEISSFTLNNKKGKIELRYPDGEVAHEVKYKKEEGIEEGEVYQKVEGGWAWIQEISNDKLQIPNNKQSSIDNSQDHDESSVIESSVIEIQEEKDLSLVTESLVAGDAVIESSVIESSIKQSSDVETEKEIIVKDKKENKFIELNNELVEIEMFKVEPNVLGIESVREIDGKYLLIPPSSEQEHYAVVFLKDMTVDANEEINRLLNHFFK